MNKPEKSDRRNPRRLKLVPARILLPTGLTVLALCAGLTAMRLGLEQRWQLAVVAILFAGILDFLDGRIARLLKGASKFGAELDSLADVVSFGVAPAILVYHWSLEALGGIGWVLALLYAVCCTLRLARFNTMLENGDSSIDSDRFFVGVPAPAAAGLVMLPMMFEFQFGVSLFEIPVLSGILMAAVSFLMVSRIPTYSFKRFAVRRDLVLPVLVGLGLFTALLTSYLWGTLVLAGVIYLASIPLSYHRGRGQMQGAKTSQEVT